MEQMKQMKQVEVEPRTGDREHVDDQQVSFRLRLVSRPVWAVGMLTGLVVTSWNITKETNSTKPESSFPCSGALDYGKETRHYVSLSVFGRSFLCCINALLVIHFLLLDTLFVSLLNGASFVRNIYGTSSRAEDVGWTHERFDRSLLPMTNSVCCC